MKRIFTLLASRLIFSLTLFLFLSCSEIERDNILDPANPSSMRDNLVVLEAFVNTSDLVPDSLSFNYAALNAINELKDTYDDRIIICEYHWHTSQFDDPLAVNDVNTIYDTYVNALESSKGVPDLFINGAANRVQGASNSSNVVTRVKQFTSPILNETGEYTIEADINRLDDVLTITYRVARLGYQRAAETRLRILTTRDNAEKGHYTVNSIKWPQIIPAISAGKYHEDSVEINLADNDTKNLVLILMDESGTKVLGALEKEI